MKLVTYQTKNHPNLGGLLNDKVVELQSAYKKMTGDTAATFPNSMIALLKEGEAGLARAADILGYATQNPNGITRPLSAVTLLAPVLNPSKVIALGRNYAAHAREGGAEPPKYPMLFHKTAGSLIGAGQPVIIPHITERVDYEGELAVIIGRTCKNVSPAEALDYAAGYTVANDITARDLQRRTSQFSAGKMIDTFGPLGPALVTKDEILNVGNLNIRTTLNGQVMQDGTTSDMIFDVPFIISYISQIATLRVGDVILTGTPEGVGYARTPPVFMKAGDEITVEIEGIGTLTNTLVNAG